MVEPTKVTIEERLENAFSGVTNGNLSTLVAKMGADNSIHIPLYPQAGNIPLLENAYNQQDGQHIINHTEDLSLIQSFQNMSAELKAEHGYKIVNAVKAPDATKIQITLEKQ